MSKPKSDSWERFKKFYVEFPTLGLAMDTSKINFPDDCFARMEEKMKRAFADMAALERGAIANPDENRMVGHYWLRNPNLAPSSEIRKQIKKAQKAIKHLVLKIHGGELRGQGGKFKNLLVIGIGGSALGPQFISDALGHPKSDKMKVFFFDNTDPDGMDRELAKLEGELNQTLVIVISKSGRTKETRNGMLEAKAAYSEIGLDFSRYAIAITGENSELDEQAKSDGWLARFPMWDWIGGRTSAMSAVAMVPSALQGIDVELLVNGAMAGDKATRLFKTKDNPAAQMAIAWYFAGNKRGEKNLIIIPYKDRLALFSKYLQQLLMESLGKELDLAGNTVNQGLTVFGNKGSTDQHSYIQQLRDGLNDYMAIFIEVLRDRSGKSTSVEPDIFSGDYLNNFLLGTRTALSAGGRESITITIQEVSPFSVGVLIAIFERAVGFYASLINVNAYNQPGVEAGKIAAEEAIILQKGILKFLRQRKKTTFSAEEIAANINSDGQIELVFKICQHLAANSQHRVSKETGSSPFETRFQSR